MRDVARSEKRRIAVGVTVALTLASVGACALFVDLGDRSLLAEAGDDGTSTLEGGTDGPIGDGGPSNNWHDASDPNNWSWVDPSAFAALAGFDAGVAFSGGSLDLQSGYLYFGPTSTTYAIAARLDTAASPDAASAWAFFNTTALSGNVAYAGVTFDGRYVYYVPYVNNVPNWSGTIGRYDTIGQFTDPSYWAFYGLPGARSVGYAGAAFDGRRVYLTPTGSNGAGSTTALAFDDAGTYVFDFVGTTPGLNANYEGAVFDGKYVYFVPHLDGTSVFRSTVFRFEIDGDFSDAGSWSGFDVTTVNEGAAGFAGGAFDGRYVYFIPLEHHPNTPGSVVARFDTMLDPTNFGDPAAWSTFDTIGLDQRAAGYSLGAFDGRYVYLLPSSYPTILVRYDTSGTFTSAGGWQVTDLSAFIPDGATIETSGAVYDGKYLYLVPYQGPLLRFDARDSWVSPAVNMPPGYAGSFY